MDFPINPIKRIPILRRGENVDNQEKQRNEKRNQKGSQGNSNTNEKRHTDSKDKPFRKEGGFEFDV